MLRTVLSFTLLAAVWAAATPALASGDFGCTDSWKLTGSQLDDCNNRPFLNPGNDSRVNLQLLLLDAGLAKLQRNARVKNPNEPDMTPTPAAPYSMDDFTSLFEPDDPTGTSTETSDRAEGEGSRCNSNPAGAQAFKAALDDSKSLPAGESAALAAARAALAPNCDAPGKAVAPPPAAPIRSALGQQFAAYLAGTTAFYGGDYDLARKSFAALSGSRQPWLKQTARYMLGRVELNRAQANAFGEYGEMNADKVDAKALAQAEADFQAYLHDYPNGDYAASARGLLRRIDWLGGKPQKLAAEFARAFVQAAPTQRNVTQTELVQEVDSKLLAKADPTAIKEPLLLATYDLMQMRPGDPKDGPKPIALESLQAQKPVFAGHEALFDYLLAAHAFYDEADPAGALKRLPASAPGRALGELDFSRQVLRGLALEASKDAAGARAHWLQRLTAAEPILQRPTLELALAMNYERGDALAQVFAPGSPIRDAALREILLRNTAGPVLLRQRAKAADADAHERRIAAFTLLYKELTRERYQGFLADLPLAPADAADQNDGAFVPPGAAPNFKMFQWGGAHGDGEYGCPALRTVAGALAKDPHAAASRLCLAEFVRLNGLDGFSLDTPPPADELGGSPSQFPSGLFSRLELYKQVLAQPKVAAAERAYALYRAVNCYAPSGYNGCGGTDVPQSQRKQWFHTLKTDYANSPWAAALKYYW